MSFTIDEETGLTGAFGLKPDLLKSRILLNLDLKTKARSSSVVQEDVIPLRPLDLETEQVPEGSVAYQVSITVLKVAIQVMI